MIYAECLVFPGSFPCPNPSSEFFCPRPKALGRISGQNGTEEGSHHRTRTDTLCAVYPGQLITDRLRLVRQLGAGGMGSVWIAHHLLLDTEVAVKFTSAELGSTDAGMARFEREARSAAKLKSPHVIKIFDYGRSVENVPYIVMELLSGADLATIIRRSLIERGVPPDPEFVRKVVEQAALGLTEAHDAGIVHRDIKPDNIFISDLAGEPFVRLLDFGIAKHVLEAGPRLTGSQDSFGTPYTMSPEQVLRPREVDFHTDLWSLAVVAYNTLTGEWPFDGETLGELYIRIDKGVFAPPTTIRPELPQVLDAWFIRALSRDPTCRFSSAHELAQTFSIAIAGHAEVPACSSSVAERRPLPAPAVSDTDTMSPAVSTSPGRRRASRRAVGYAVGAAGLLVAVGGGVGRFVLGWGTPEPSPSKSVQTVAPKLPRAASASQAVEDSKGAHEESAPAASNAVPAASGSAEPGASVPSGMSSGSVMQAPSSPRTTGGRTSAGPVRPPREAPAATPGQESDAAKRKKARGF